MQKPEEVGRGRDEEALESIADTVLVILIALAEQNGFSARELVQAVLAKMPNKLLSDEAKAETPQKQEIQGHRAGFRERFKKDMERLKVFLKAQRVTQNQLAVKMGMDKINIYRWLNDNGHPNAEHLASLRSAVEPLGFTFTFDQEESVPTAP